VENWVNADWQTSMVWSYWSVFFFKRGNSLVRIEVFEGNLRIGIRSGWRQIRRNRTLHITVEALGSLWVMEMKGALNYSLLTTLSITLSSQLQLYFPICGFVTIIGPCSSPKISVFEFRDNAHSKYEWFTPNRLTSGLKCQPVKRIVVHTIEIS
jgi:hypothetical protein